MIDAPPAYLVGDQQRHRAFFELLVGRLIYWMAGQV